MSEHFFRGARIAYATDDDEVTIDGLTDCAILFEATKTTARSPDFVGKGSFQGVGFKIHAIHRSSKTGHPMLKLFFVPLKAPPARG